MVFSYRRQSRWIVAAAVLGLVAIVIYAWQSMQSPTRLSGGSTVGLWYGVLGGGLMLAVGLLALHRRLPHCWHLLGPRREWLKFHIWFSFLSLILVICHSGFSWGGTLTIWLWWALILVFVSGVWGTAVQHFLPRLMRGSLPREAPYDQIPQISQRLLELCDGLAVEIRTRLKAAESAGLDKFERTYAETIRPLFQSGRMRFGSVRGTPAVPRTAEIIALVFAELRADPNLADTQAELAAMEAYCQERVQLVRQEKFQFWLHNWLAVHIPAAVVMYVLMVYHAVVTMSY